jgi:DNA-binding CsgD family transcriptional regulator
MGDPDPTAIRRQLRDQGRAAYQRRDWADAYSSLSAADGHGPLDPDDLYLLATAAFLLGHEDACDALTARAYREWLNRGDHGWAARCAFWQGLRLILVGEGSRGTGWLKRAQQHADAVGPDAVEQGYIQVPRALELLVAGDAAGAYATSENVVSYAERSGDLDLMTFGRLGLGQALIHLGDVSSAMAHFDEVMVAVTSDEVSPVVAGIVYCAAIESCQRAFDLRRAQEWTAALSQWCAMQPDLVPYRGQCQIHRAEIMQLRGEWADAFDEARLACDRLGGQAAEGAALYQVGELHRLRGEFADAERAFLAASRWMPEPQPGLALLRLAQGRVDAARAAIEHTLGEVAVPAKVRPSGWSIARARLLGAYVEIMVADGDTAAARAGAEELRTIADTFGGPWLHALATTADASALVAERAGAAALEALREAWAAWQELDAPYEAARVRVLMAVVCQQQGDTQTAEMELDAARWVFEELGAGPDAARASRLSRSAGTGVLTARETQVLRLVATGKTNRVIAAELFLSEKTVARHVSNIFVKLDVSSRAAATAYAYEHGLV